MNCLGLIFGPNGSGKGTLADGLSINLKNYVHLNSGKLIKDWAIKNQNQEIISKIDNGILVDNFIVKHSLESAFRKYKKRNLIIEGFPRKYSQNKILKTLLLKYHYKISWIINLYLPKEEIIKRLNNRIEDIKTGKTYHSIYKPPPKGLHKNLQKRKDDNENIIQKRFKFFIQNTVIVLSNPDFLDIPIINIDARKSINEVLNISLEFITQYCNR